MPPPCGKQYRVVPLCGWARRTPRRPPKGQQAGSRLTMTKTMRKLTVLIPCKDERQNIADCVESVRAIADEILVADSGSSDGTPDIVRRLGSCRIIEREFVSYAD